MLTPYDEMKGVVEEVEGVAEVMHLPWGVMVNVEIEALWAWVEVVIQVVDHYMMVLKFQRKKMSPQLTQLETVGQA